MTAIPNGLFGVLARKNAISSPVLAFHGVSSQKPGGGVSVSNHAFTGLTEGDLYGGIILSFGINTTSVVTNHGDAVATREPELVGSTSGIYAWGFDFTVSAASTTITLDSTQQSGSVSYTHLTLPTICSV